MPSNAYPCTLKHIFASSICVTVKGQWDSVKDLERELPGLQYSTTPQLFVDSM